MNDEGISDVKFSDLSGLRDQLVVVVHGEHVGIANWRISGWGLKG